MKYKLSDVQIRQAKTKDKDYPLADGGGLRLIVRASGSKVFVFNYAKPFTKKKSNITIGKYPEISLAQARAEHSRMKSLLAQDVDPVNEREQTRQQQAEKLTLTFGNMAKLWIEDRKQKADFSERTAKETWALFERHILPHFAHYPIAEITPLIAIEAFKPLERSGKLETIRKAISKLNEVMRFCLHRGLIQSNVLADIIKEFDKPSVKSMNTISPEELAEFLASFYQKRDEGAFSLNVFYAVMLSLLTGGRPSEIASAKWSDINQGERLWSYRVQKGNKNRPEGRLHFVTLSTQALAIFEKMKTFNALLYPNAAANGNEYVFFSPTAKSGHISIETMRNAIIKAIGIGRLTTHGIRHLFSTALNERNYNGDWIERALSHKDKNRIRGSYNKAEYINQRFDMLQDWADYVESIAPKPFL